MDAVPDSDVSKDIALTRPAEGSASMEVMTGKEVRECHGGPSDNPSLSGPPKGSLVVKVPAAMVAGNSPTSREMLNEQAQMLIDEVNAKRKRDTSVLGDFKKAMEIQTTNAYNMVEQNVFQLYEQNGKQLQDKLQELFATLDRIAKLELELDQFKVALGALYTEMH